MSAHYVVSIYTKLRTDLPKEWVDAFSSLVNAQKPEDVVFPDIPGSGYGGNEIPCMIRFPCWNAQPTYGFGRCHDSSTFDGEKQYSYHLTFSNIMLDDEFYHVGFALLQFLAEYSVGNRFAGTMYEAGASFPDLIYFINGELQIVGVGSDGKGIDKVSGVSGF
jgi:hypothetical protein